MKRFRPLLIVVFTGMIVAPVLASRAFGQAPARQTPTPGTPADPIATSLKGAFDGIGRNLSESAAKMPEENFAFKPTPEVRSFGELLGHVANSQYSYCSRVKGEANPNSRDFEKLTAKADLVKAIDESIAYCRAVYQSMTDAKLVEPVMPAAAATGERGQGRGAQGAPRPVVPFAVLNQNLTHDWEHYGNIVTYLRLKGLVPPSTERAQMGRGRGRGGNPPGAR